MPSTRYMSTSNAHDNKNNTSVAEEDSPSFIVATSQPATAVIGSVYGNFDGSGAWHHLLLNCVNRIEVWETMAPAATGFHFTSESTSGTVGQEDSNEEKSKSNQRRVQEEYQKHNLCSGDDQSGPPALTLVAQFPVYGTVRHLMAVSLPSSNSDHTHDGVGVGNQTSSHFPRLAVMIVTEKQDLSLILLHRLADHDKKSRFGSAHKGILRHRTLYRTNFTTSLFKQNYSGTALWSTTSDTAAAAEGNGFFTDYRKGSISSKVMSGGSQSLNTNHYLMRRRPLVALCYHRYCIVLIDIAACIAFGAENQVMGDIISRSQCFGEQAHSQGHDHSAGSETKRKMKKKLNDDKNLRSRNNNTSANGSGADMNLCDLFGDPAAAGGTPPQEFRISAPTTEQLGQYLESLHCFSKSAIYDIILKVGSMTCPCSFCPLDEAEPKSITFHYHTCLSTSTGSNSPTAVSSPSSSVMSGKQHLMNYTVSSGLLLVVLYQDHRGRSHVRRYTVQDTLLVDPSPNGPMTESEALSLRTEPGAKQGVNNDDDDNNNSAVPADPRAGAHDKCSNINSSSLYTNNCLPTVTSILNRSVLRMTNKPRGLTLGHSFKLQGDVESDATLLYSVPGGILVIGSSLATFLSTDKNGHVMTSLTPSPFARSTPRLAVRVSPVCTLVGYQNGAVIGVTLHEVSRGKEMEVVCHVVSPQATPMVSMTQVGQCCVFLGSAYSNSMFMAWDGATAGVIQKEEKAQECGYGVGVARYDDDEDLLFPSQGSDSRSNKNNNSNRYKSLIEDTIDPLKAVSTIYNGVSLYIAVENTGPIVDMCVADTSGGVPSNDHFQQQQYHSILSIADAASKTDSKSNSSALTCNLPINGNPNKKPLSIVAASGIDIFGALHVLRTAMQLTEEASLFDVCGLASIHVAGPLSCGSVGSGVSHDISIIALSFDHSTKFLSATRRRHHTGTNNKLPTGDVSPAVQLDIEELDFGVETSTLLMKALPSSSTRGSSVVLHATAYKASIVNVSVINGVVQMIEAYSVSLLHSSNTEEQTISSTNTSLQQPNESSGSFTSRTSRECTAFAIDPMYTTLVAAAKNTLFLYELPSLELMRCVNFEEHEEIACIDITEKFEVIVGLWSCPYRLMVLSAEDMTPRVLVSGLPSLPRSVKCTQMKTTYPTSDHRAVRYLFVGFSDGTVGYSEVVGRNARSSNEVHEDDDDKEVGSSAKATEVLPVMMLKGQFQQHIIGTTPITLVPIIGHQSSARMNRTQRRECSNESASTNEEGHQEQDTMQLPESILCCGNSPAILFESRGSIVSTGFGANAADLCAQLFPSLFVTYSRIEQRVSFVSGNSHVKSRINKLTTPVRATIPRMKYIPEWDMYTVALRERDQDVIHLYGLSSGGDALVQHGAGGVGGGAIYISGTRSNRGAGALPMPPSSSLSATASSSAAASTFKLLECERCEFVEWIHLNGPPFEVSPEDDQTRLNTGVTSLGNGSYQGHRAAYITAKFDYSQPFSALLVGTNFVYPNDDVPRNGRILLLVMERADTLESSPSHNEVDRCRENARVPLSSPWSLIQICEKDVQGMLLCACMMPKTSDRVILGISGGVHVFRWSAKEMNFKPEVGIAVGGAVMKIIPLSGSVLGYSAKAEEARAKERKKLLDLRRRTTRGAHWNNREQALTMGNDAEEEEDVLRAAAAHNPSISSPLLNSVLQPFSHPRTGSSVGETIDTRHSTTDVQEDEISVTSRNTRTSNVDNNRDDNEITTVTGQALLSNDLLDSTSALIAVADVRNSITILEINSIDLIRVEAMDLIPREIMDILPLGSPFREWSCCSSVSYGKGDISRNTEYIDQSELPSTVSHPDDPYRHVEPSFYNPKFLVSDTDLNIYVMGADPRHLGLPLSDKKRRVVRRSTAVGQASRNRGEGGTEEAPNSSEAQATSTATEATWQSTKKKKKLVATAQFHIGDRVTVFQRGSFQTYSGVSLSFPSTLHNSDHSRELTNTRPKNNKTSLTMSSFIFGTVHGMLGTVLTIPRFTRNVLSLLSDVILSVLSSYRFSKSFGSLDYHLFRDVFRRDQLPPNFHLHPCMPLFVESSNSNFYYDDLKDGSNARYKKQRRLPVPNVDSYDKYETEEEDDTLHDRDNGYIVITTYQGGANQYKTPNNPRKNLHANSHNNFIDADLLFQFIEHDSLCMDEIPSDNNKMKKLMRLRMREGTAGIKQPLPLSGIDDSNTGTDEGQTCPTTINNNTSITEEFIVMQLNLQVARAYGNGSLVQGTSISMVGCGAHKIKTDDAADQHSSPIHERGGNRPGSLNKGRINLSPEEVDELSDMLLVHGLPSYPFKVVDLKAFLYELKRKC